MSIKQDLTQIINNLCEQAESNELEFKESLNKLPKDIWETYSAFANTHGGFIILGVKEKPHISITGVNNPDQIIRDLFNTANNKSKISHNLLEDKNVIKHTIDGKCIISIFIPEQEQSKKPVYLNNNYAYTYIRKNEGDYIVSDDELRRFIRNASDDLDSELLDEYTLEDLNLESVLAFKNIINARNPSMHYLEMDNLEFLIEMGVFQLDRKDKRRPKLTIAGLLFLGTYDAIRSKLPQFHLEYINRRGISATDRWIDRVSTGDLNYKDLNVFGFFQIVREKLNATIEDSFELDENSIRKSPVELKTALREALANMLIHADYFDNTSDIKVVVDNYFYNFHNPGMMRVSVTQFFAGGKSLPRNNTLITFFRRMGISDRAGTGGKTILTFAIANKYQMPELEVTTDSTTLKLWVATPRGAHPELDDDTRKVLAYINEKKNVSKSQIISDTGLSAYKVRKALNTLIDNHIIFSLGKGRATRYSWSPSVIERVDAANRIRDLIIQDYQ